MMFARGIVGHPGVVIPKAIRARVHRDRGLAARKPSTSRMV